MAGFSGAGGEAGVTDHGLLDGLTDDDHTIYLQDVVDDLTPQLAAALDAQTFDLDNVGAIDLEGGQIAFPAVQLASADPNTFDDYEIGTFTIEVGDNDSDGSGEGQSYSRQLGRYTKYGNRVCVQGQITATSVGTLTGNQAVRLLGLPFVSSNEVGAASVINVNGVAGLALPVAQDSLNATAGKNTSYLLLGIWEATTGTNGLLVSEFSATGNIEFSGFYEV